MANCTSSGITDAKEAEGNRSEPCFEWWETLLPEFALRERFRRAVSKDLSVSSPGKPAASHKEGFPTTESADPKGLWEAYRAAGASLPLSNAELIAQGFPPTMLEQPRSRLNIAAWKRLHRQHCRVCQQRAPRSRAGAATGLHTSVRSGNPAPGLEGKTFDADEPAPDCYFAGLVQCLERGFTLPFYGPLDQNGGHGTHAPPIAPRGEEDRALLLDRKKEDEWQARVPVEGLPFTYKDVYSAPSFVARKKVFSHVDFREPRVVTCFNATVNPMLRVPSFSLISVTDIVQELQPGDKLGIVDLSSAFLQIPMAPETWRYLGVQTDPNDPTKVELYRKLPFGLSIAPLIFSMVSAEVMAICRGRGLRVYAYYDDFPIICREGSEREEFEEFRSIMGELGLKFKEEKVHKPSDRATVLGYEIDVQQGTMRLRDGYIETLAAIYILEEATRVPPSVQELRSIAGRVVHAAAVVIEGRLRVKGFFTALGVARAVTARRRGETGVAGSLGNANRSDRLFPLMGKRSPRLTKEHVLWWQEKCRQITSGANSEALTVSLRCASALRPETIRSDASLDYAATAIHKGHIFLAAKDEWVEYFSNSTDAELLAALLPVLVSPERFRNTRIVCQIDNAGACYLLNTLRAKRDHVVKLLDRVMRFQRQFHAVVVASWVCREKNKEADSWTRFRSLTDSPAQALLGSCRVKTHYAIV